jgi:hypothetical protein
MTATDWIIESVMWFAIAVVVLCGEPIIDRIFQ